MAKYEDIVSCCFKTKSGIERKGWDIRIPEQVADMLHEFNKRMPDHILVGRGEEPTAAMRCRVIMRTPDGDYNYDFSISGDVDLFISDIVAWRKRAKIIQIIEESAEPEELIME